MEELEHYLELSRRFGVRRGSICSFEKFATLQLRETSLDCRNHAHFLHEFSAMRLVQYDVALKLLQCLRAPLDSDLRHSGDQLGDGLPLVLVVVKEVEYYLD